MRWCIKVWSFSFGGTRADLVLGREVATGRQVAIKKIKVGQFKDGLDMSAIREVKYLRELKHQNVIEVRFQTFSVSCRSEIDPAIGRLFVENEPQPGLGVP